MSHLSTRMSTFWRARSLRFWLISGMSLAILPLAASALAGYLLYRAYVVDPLVEDAWRQRAILRPLQDMQLGLWEYSGSVNDFVVEQDQAHLDQLPRERRRIEAALETLDAAVAKSGLDAAPLAGARKDWNELVALVDTIARHRGQPADPALIAPVESFEQGLDGLAGDLEALLEEVEAETEARLEQALAALVLSERVALASFFVSLFFIGLGVLIINRSLVASMDELAGAAMRVAAGEREHHVQIRIPRELVSVANAFNTMTDQILEQERSLANLAQTDGLTGLLNRREFDRILGDEVRRGERYGTPVSLIMIDVDHFKRFNDSHGHQCGDEALRTVARALAANVRESDRACRFGGEELAVILPASDSAAAQRVAERIRETIAAQQIPTPAGGPVQVTASLGLSTAPESGNTPEALLAAADAALYRSKEAGRNRVTAAPPTA